MATQNHFSRLRGRHWVQVMTVRWERAATCYLMYVESGGITSAGGGKSGCVQKP